MAKRTVVCDIEANGLLPKVNRIFCIVCKDWDTGEITSFTEKDDFDGFTSYASTVDTWIGHNFIAYDLRVIRKVLKVRIRPSKVYDTLLVSRLQQYSREGGHSLANWGRILNFPKKDPPEFDEFTEDMLDYCINDVELTYKVANYLKREGKKYGSESAERVEHLSQHLLQNQQDFGFALNVDQARQLLSKFTNEANRLELEIVSEIHPRPKLLRLVEPRYTKKGELSKVGLKSFGEDYEAVAGPFGLIEFEDFNVGSPKQKVERLNPWWSPVVRTKGYRKLNDKLRNGEITQEEFDTKQATMWKLCEENFETISPDAPKSLRKLGEQAMYTARMKEVEGWFDALGDDDRVHGEVFSIGAITHRMSHNTPNTANIPSTDSPYGAECRACFTVGDPVNYRLLGCDAAGIQLRILAHYMNDPDYTDLVVNGDVHTKNLEVMGIDKGEWSDDRQQWSARATAKTFIYAWLLGAGDEKVGLICGSDAAFGRRVKTRFLEGLPALAKLKERAARAARSGRLVGLDGRKIELKSAHFALSCYLQGAESVIMKTAMIDWHNKVHRMGLDARQVAVVHDEFQVEVHKDHAEQVGEIIKKSIIDAGKRYEMNCPLDADYRIGLNWLDTH